MLRLVMTFTAVLVPAVLPATGTAAEPASRPNILFILSDDQRFDAMGHRNGMVQTPNLDRLARQGVEFKNAFVTTSICAASRASILTGTVERTHGYTFDKPPVPAKYADNCYPLRLRAAGYRTGFVGKYGVVMTGDGVPNKMFDSYVPLNRNPYFKKQPDGSERHLTDIEADKAIEFLGGCKPDQPFCLSVSFNAPHAEDNDKRQYIWPKAFDNLYKDLTIPKAPLSEPEFLQTQPKFFHDTENRVRWGWRFTTPESYQEMVKGYFRMITGVDAAIGRILDELKNRKLDRDTVIIFTSDNGYFLNDRGYADKWLPYEPSLRVPLIVLDPRPGQQKAGSQPTPMVLNIDIPVTILDLAGVEVPATMQGRSMRPLVKGEKYEPRKDFFFEHLMEHPRIVKHEGVRTERYKYARYFEQKPVYEELYDFVADPLEKDNLVNEPKHAELLKQLRKRCDDLRDQYGGVYKAPPPVTKPKKPE